MPSENTATLTTLDKDLPTTRHDTEALRRLRSESMTIDQYLEFLACLPSLPTTALRTRKAPRGEEEFRL